MTPVRVHNTVASVHVGSHDHAPPTARPLHVHADAKAGPKVCAAETKRNLLVLAHTVLSCEMLPLSKQHTLI